jgi:hypothetical protein
MLKINNISNINNKNYILIFIAVVYYFLMFSYNLFFITIPKQSDINAVSLFNYIIDNNLYITSDLLDYFQYPMFFTFFSVIKNILNLSSFGIINIGFFIQLLLIPIIYFLFIYNKNQNHNIFISGSILIILIFFQFNGQMVPQFLGFIYLLLTIGCYSRFIREKSMKWYLIVILFYIMCLYTHPFMVYFFILGLGIKKLISIFMHFVRKRNISVKNFIKFLKNEVYKKDISIILLLILYFHGYYFRFVHFKNTVQNVLDPQTNINSTKAFLFQLINIKTNDQNSIENIRIFTHPLYHVVPKSIYLFLKYLNLSLIIILIIIIIYILFKYISLKKIKIFDFSFVFGALIFFTSGIFNPMILGNRAIQVVFISPSKYIYKGFIRNNNLKYILMLIILIAPITFNINYSITSTLSGDRFSEDISTINMGKFYSNHHSNQTDLLLPDRLYYPLIINVNRTRSENIPTLYRLSNGTTNVDIILRSPKFDNNLINYLILDFLI